MNSEFYMNGLPPLPRPSSAKQKSSISQSKDSSFQGLLQNELHTVEELKLSKHAEKRIHARDVDITAGEWRMIENKVKAAKEKGVTDSIVLTDNAALVISTKNHTVVTAMTRTEAADHIFTNINGTIVV